MDYLEIIGASYPNALAIKLVLKAMAEFEGEADYDSDSDRTSYSCPFCPAAWEKPDIQSWWDAETIAYHSDVLLEKHAEDCPVYLARVLLGIKPNADPVVCLICGQENWNNKNGWNGTEEEYNLYWDSRSPIPAGLNKEVRSTCCKECQERQYLYRTNWSNRKQEERRLELAKPGQIEKEREGARAALQRHFDRVGIKGQVVWDDSIHGFKTVIDNSI